METISILNSILGFDFFFAIEMVALGYITFGFMDHFFHKLRAEICARHKKCIHAQAEFLMAAKYNVLRANAKWRGLSFSKSPTKWELCVAIAQHQLG